MYKLILFTLSIALYLIGISNHEMWFDEVQAIGRVIESHSLLDLLKQLPYEGHPPLYYLLLYPFSLFFNAATSLLIVQTLLYLILTYLIHIKSSLDIESKLLLVANYFLIFEYSLFTRPYTLICIMLFLLSYSIYQKHEKLKWITLTLMPFVHAFTFIISASYILISIFDKRTLKNKFKYSLFAVITHIIIGFYMSPPKDLKIYGLTHTSFDFERLMWTINHIGRSFFPMFKLETNFWNTHIFNDSYLLLLVLSALSFFFIIISFKGNKKVATWILLSFSGLYFLFYLKIQGAYRHYGIFFILILSLISFSYNSRSQIEKNIFKFILFIQFSFGSYAYYMDLTTPFSSAKETAHHINNNKNLNRLFLVGDAAMSSPSVSLYLNRPIFMLRTMEAKRYLDYQKRNDDCLHLDHDFKRNIFQMKCYKNLSKLSKTKEILLITNYELLREIKENYNFELIFKSSQAIYRQEEYWVYKQKKILNNQN